MPEWLTDDQHRQFPPFCAPLPMSPVGKALPRPCNKPLYSRLMCQSMWLSLSMSTVLALALACGDSTGAEDGGKDAGPVEVTIDVTKSHQSITGWGTCLVTWKPPLRQLYQSPEFLDYYANELGCNILRINLWPKVSPRPVADPKLIRWQDFTFTGDADRIRVFIDFARALRQRNPDALLIGTVWSPPAWMKHSNNINDDHSGAIRGDSYKEEKTGNLLANRLDMSKLDHFAAWMVAYVKLFDDAGIPLIAVSIANEPQFTQWFESCVWTAQDYAARVRAVGEALEAAGYGDVLIYGPETMTGFNWPRANPLYVQNLMGDPGVARHFDVFATHGYSDGFNADNSRESAWSLARLIAPHKRPYWVTEGGTGGHEWPAPIGGMAMSLHNALVHGGASAVVPWQITEEKGDDGSLMEMGEPTAKTHVARHWFAFIRPGAVRVDVWPPDSGGVHVSAFLHRKDRKLTLVLVNSTATERPVNLSLPPGATPQAAVRTSETERSADIATVAISHGKARVLLPAQSVTTLQYAWTP